MNADNASGSQQELQQMKTHFPIALDLTEEMNAERRRCSPSEPLLPETINFIRHNLQRPEYHFEELPNVFVVFGASVSGHLLIYNFWTLKLILTRVIYQRKKFSQHFGGFTVMDFYQRVDCS